MLLNIAMVWCSPDFCMINCLHAVHKKGILAWPHPLSWNYTHLPTIHTRCILKC